jgi:two-component system LytT family sensor kinase
MKNSAVENILNQKKVSTHIYFLLFSMAGTGSAIIIKNDYQVWHTYLSIFLLIFIQLEVFIFLAGIIFKDLKSGKTSKEVTRIILSRFALFYLACFFAAIIIALIFHYAQQLLIGGDLSKVPYNFIHYEFKTWFKATITGLTLGGVIFIIIQWQDALKREQKLREENLIFQNETLKTQINPHFLFNSLNTVSSLIQSHPEKAEEFINNLSSVYRYILDNRQKDKVSLQDEVDLIKSYFNLHRVRDEEKIMLNIEISDPDEFKILPVSLQILIENAIKHNIATRENPLRISVYVENDNVVVKNNLQKKASQLKSTQIGLKNLSERIRLISGRNLIIEETNNYFIVKVPLLT